MCVSCDYCILSSKVSARGRSLIQRSSTEGVVSESVREALIMTRPWPIATVVPWKINIYLDP